MLSQVVGGYCGLSREGGRGVRVDPTITPTTPTTPTPTTTNTTAAAAAATMPPPG